MAGSYKFRGVVGVREIDMLVAVSLCRLCFLRTFPFSQINYYTIKTNAHTCSTVPAQSTAAGLVFRDVTVGLEAAGERDVTEGVQVRVKVTARAVSHNLSIKRTYQNQFVIDLVVPGYGNFSRITIAGKSKLTAELLHPIGGEIIISGHSLR